jgi:hypothetical protein
MTQQSACGGFAKFRDGTGKPLQKMTDEIRPSTNGFIMNAEAASASLVVAGQHEAN